MIKRALGIWNDEGGDDDDEGLTQKETEKLTKRLLPGGRGGAIDYAKATAAVDGQEEDEEEASDEELISGDEAYDSDDSEIPMPVPGKVEKTQFRGKFQCKLCPNKVIMNEQGLEDHMQSKSHLKREADFDRAKEIGLAALEAEVKAKVKAKASDEPTKRDKKKAEYWTQRRERIQKNSGVPTIQKELTGDQIERRKARFQKKKDRRLAKKGESKDSSEKTSSKTTLAKDKSPKMRKGSSDASKVETKASKSAQKLPNRQARRAALQAAYVEKVGKQSAKDPSATGDSGPPKKKKKKEA